MRKLINFVLIILMVLTFLNLGSRSVNSANWTKDQFGNWYSGYQEGSEVNKAGFSLETYYKKAEAATTQSGLLSALRTILQDGFNSLTYKYSGETGNALKDCDEHPTDKSSVICIYTDRAINKNAGSNAWNQEHVWPQSKLSGNSYSDIIHLHASESGINSTRGNKDFNVVTGGSTDSYGNEWNSTYFEPQDSKKGDIARSVLYLITMYDNLKLVERVSGSNELGIKSVLLSWHELDPVDDLERRRNDRVYNHQGNRNPFIDHPEYANILYGTNYEVDGADYLKVKFDALGGTYDYQDLTKYNSGDLISEPQVKPTKYGYQFVGWYKDKNLSQKWNFSTDKIRENQILYAKYEEITDPISLFEIAKFQVAMKFNYDEEEGSASLSDSIDFSSLGLPNATIYEKYEGENATISFSANPSGNNPAIYSNALRMYSKSSFTITSEKNITEVLFEFVQSGDKGMKGVSSEVGNYVLTDLSGKWTGSAKTIKFDVGKDLSSGHQAIKSITVTFGGSSEHIYTIKDAKLMFKLDLGLSLVEELSLGDISFKINDQEVLGAYLNGAYYLEFKALDLDQLFSIKAYLDMGSSTYQNQGISYSIKTLALKYLDSYKDLPEIKAILPILRQIVK